MICDLTKTVVGARALRRELDARKGRHNGITTECPVCKLPGVYVERLVVKNRHDCRWLHRVQYVATGVPSQDYVEVLASCPAP